MVHKNLKSIYEPLVALGNLLSTSYDIRFTQLGREKIVVNTYINPSWNNVFFLNYFENP